jgi:hypothetical protein
MDENLCGNCVSGVELSFVRHFICVHLIFSKLRDSERQLRWDNHL